jgi:DNA-binding XRE family transcriptional regulator
LPRGTYLPPKHVLDARPPLAREITIRRVLANMTQRELASRVGITWASLENIEQGRVRPGTTLLTRIWAVLESGN